VFVTELTSVRICAITNTPTEEHFGRTRRSS